MDMHAIDEEIETLKESDTTYQNCQKLATLYIIRDHYKDKIAEYSHASSKFLQAVSDAPMDDVLKILDEHMEAIQILHPKEYSAIISKIKDLKKA